MQDILMTKNQLQDTSFILDMDQFLRVEKRNQNVTFLNRGRIYWCIKGVSRSSMDHKTTSRDTSSISLSNHHIL